MNLNTFKINKNRWTNVVSLPTLKVKQVMGPPKQAPPSRKSHSTPSSTHWGRNYQNIATTFSDQSASTTLSTESESRVIVALTEGRCDARGEVGIASMDIAAPSMLLCQMSDVQSYINTLTKINILNPTDIIVPSTFLESGNRLLDKVRQQFPKIKILGVPRKTFNKSHGMDRILELCVPSANTICVGLEHKYYAVSAANALIAYLQDHLNIYFAKGSINVCYQESEGYTIIDVSTADRLELVASTKPTLASRFSSLFGVLNYCVTRIGARLLRSTILQPPCLPQSIEATSSCVTELMKHPQTVLEIQNILQKVSHIDQVLTISTICSRMSNEYSVKQLNYLLLLNRLLDLIEPLSEITKNCQQPFFKDLNNTLKCGDFNSVARVVRAIIHTSAQFAKREAGVQERCFAIKPGVNEFLDLVRRTYSERLDDMAEYVKFLASKYNLPLTLANNSTKGYHIVLKLNGQQKRTMKKSDLPSEFMQVYRLAGSFTMKTEELLNLSTRLEDIMFEIINISNMLIHNTLVQLKGYIGFFYKFCEDIARLDMLQSLAEASRRGKYIRPHFSEFTEVTNARHPMLEVLIGDNGVSNPIAISKDYNVQIITGPNGSGKSIYIRQIMLLQVMAQVGCYVPADSAIFRPMNRMFARVFLDDNMEYGASAFILEMKEIKYMMSLLSENSLFIIDELCRSTAVNEGIALARAICEKFVPTTVFLFVTTHYIPLTTLADLYLNVKTWQMETDSTGTVPQDLELKFKYRLIPGVTNLMHYGIYMVKYVWPKSLLEEIYSILSSLKTRTEQQQKLYGIDERLKIKYSFESEMRKLKSKGKLTVAVLNKLLNDYQNELQKHNVCVNLRFNNDTEFDFSDDRSVQDSHHVDIIDNDNGSDSSSYKNLSNFLRQDSENINKLYPEITITCPNREFNVGLENSAICDDGDGMLMASCHNEESHFQREMGQDISASPIDSKETPSTPTPSCARHIEDDELIKSIMDDIESYGESFFDDEEFGLSQQSSCRPVNNPPHFEQGHTSHFIPNVVVNQGPAWLSDSSTENTPQRKFVAIDETSSQMSQSISYSPLGSPCSNAETSVNVDSRKSETTTTNGFTTSASSLHFVNKVDGNADVPTIEINLETTSTNRAGGTTTEENLGTISASLEKPSSSSKSTTGLIENSSSIKESDSSSLNGPPKKKIIGKRGSSHGNTNSKESTSSGQKRFKFIPPRILTKKEIREEFMEQDRKIYESAVSSTQLNTYLSQMLKRPSARQVQGTEHLAFARRTEEGVEVIPPAPRKPKKRKLFLRQLSSSKSVDITIFSDKKAKSLAEFLTSAERDVKRFKFNLTPEDKDPVTDREFSFQPTPVPDCLTGKNQVVDQNSEFWMRSQDSRNFEVSNDNELFFDRQGPVATQSSNCSYFAAKTILSPVRTENPFVSQNFVVNMPSLTSLTPEGYYKQNKQDINQIVHKYLHEDLRSEPSYNYQSNNNFSIFESGYLDDSDLNL